MPTPQARPKKRAGSIDGREMTKLEVHENPAVAQKCVGTIAMVTRDQVSAHTAISWTMIDQSYLSPGEWIKKYIMVGDVLPFQRNQCINDMEGDWILFVDSDMVWQPSAIKTIVETQAKFDLDIVGGLCFQRVEPFQPTLYKSNPRGDGYIYLEQWPEDVALEVDATGMAFCLIHRRVLERISQNEMHVPFPSDEDRKEMVPIPFFSLNGQFGEDFQFCRDAQGAGCRIFVDTSVKIGHVGQVVITEETFLRELAFRPKGATDFRTMALGSIGEKILSRKEALRKLGWRS